MFKDISFSDKSKECKKVVPKTIGLCYLEGRRCGGHHDWEDMEGAGGSAGVGEVLFVHLDSIYLGIYLIIIH